MIMNDPTERSGLMSGFFTVKRNIYLASNNQDLVNYPLNREKTINKSGVQGERTK